MTTRHTHSRLGLVAALGTVSLLFVFIVSAGAVVPAPTCSTTNHVTGSNFEIELNANHADGPGDCIDWLDAGGQLLPSVQSKNDLPTGSGDNSFGQGTAEDNPNPTIVDGSIPPNKSDLRSFGVNSETTTAGKSLQLFWSRVQNPSGTTNMDFELNAIQCDGTPAKCANNGTSKAPVYVTPKRSVGDKLITYDLSKGGTVPGISIRSWSGSAWGPATVISGASSTAAFGSVNTTGIPSGISGLSYDPFTFGEASIAYSAIFSGTTECGTFGSAYLKSRSSDSFTSEIKDFIAPEPVFISNCAGIVTQASGPVTVGSEITDTATLSSVSENAGGSITFKLYSDSGCTTEIFSSNVPVDGPGDYTSGGFTPSSPGTYYWIASYNGDANNTGVSGECGDANESSVVNQAKPTLATGVAQSVIVGATINDRATLSGAALTSGSVGGSIEFKLYGPFTDDTPADDSCEGTPLATIAGSALVTANAGVTFTSDASYVTSAVGRYRWVATYSGDARNKAAGPTACLDAAELDTVNPVVSGITTSQAWYPNDTATITGGGGGTVDFKLYGPFAPAATPDCTGTPVVSALNRPVSGGVASTGNTTQSITAAGKYAWLVVYSGDATHTGATSACGVEQFTLTVTNG